MSVDFSVADPSGSSEMIMMCFMACNVKQSSTTVKPPTPSLLSEENGRYVTMVDFQ